MSRPVENVLAALRAAGCKPTKSGAGWSARCPAHDDRSPSLSIGVGDDGRALVTCHAGCSLSAVLGELGLSERDLFTVGGSSRGNGTPRPKAKRAWPSLDAAITDLSRPRGAPSTTWTYSDVHGEPVGAVIRWDRNDGDKNILPLSRTDDSWALTAMKPPRPLYNLPALANAERVYVCEGEKAADAAISCGLTATTSAGGSDAAAQSDWSPLAGKDVIVLPDHDDAGEKYAEDAASLALKAGATSARIVRLIDAWPDMPAGGDMADLIGVDGPWGGWDDEDIRCAVDALADAAEDVSAQSPARFEPFPVDALPEPIRSYVAAGAAAIGCDASFVALPTLAALAGAIGNSRCIMLKRGWTEPAIVWTAIVGESGTLKTPAFKLAARPVRARQHRLMKEHAETMKRWESDEALYEIEFAQWKKKAAKDEAPPDPPEAPEKPICPRAWIEDCTTEALATLLQENPRGLLTLRNELSGWFSFGQYKHGGGADDVARWLQMFDGDALIVDRKTTGSIYVPRAAVSIAGGIQPGVLERSLGQQHRENGLLARLLLANPPRRAKRWSEAEVDPLIEGDVMVLFDRLYALEPDVDADGDPTPRLVRLNPEAKQAWISFVNEHGAEQVKLVGEEAAAWSKLEGYAARFALVIHLVRAAADDPSLVDQEVVDETSVAQGVRLSRWFAAEAVRVYAMLSEDDETREGRRFVDLIDRHGGSVTIRQWQRIRSLKRARDAEAELDALVKAGEGRWELTPPGPKGGRRSRRFVLAGKAGPSDRTSPGSAPDGPGGP